MPTILWDDVFCNTSLPLLMEDNFLNRDYALAFFYGNELIGLDVWNRISLAAGPYNLQAYHLSLFRLAQAKGQRQLALGQIARTGFHHLKQVRTFVGREDHLRANSITI
jgi:hypothetical protein